MTSILPFLDGPSPLPGTESPSRALFVDRWGTLLKKPEDAQAGSLGTPAFYEGVLDALFRCTQAGWMIYLIGNETDVANGCTDESEWKRFESEMVSVMHAHGVRVARSYACLEDPAHGKGERQRDSVFLLPNTGAMYHARQFDGIRLDQSWVIGDSTLELAAGWRAGCQTAGVCTGVSQGDTTLETDISFEAPNLTEALDTILQLAQVAAR
jgi:D-glycero-D-manno-heptose 1,7-bisphosphate phosphatase